MFVSIFHSSDLTKKSIRKKKLPRYKKIFDSEKKIKVRYALTHCPLKDVLKCFWYNPSLCSPILICIDQFWLEIIVYCWLISRLFLWMYFHFWLISIHRHWLATYIKVNIETDHKNLRLINGRKTQTITSEYMDVAAGFGIKKYCSIRTEKLQS